MLKHIDPILNADLLQALRQMGHGDEIAIVDANFPAYSQGPRVVRLDGVDATRALDAILSLMPLDDFTPEACWRMQVVGAPEQEQPIFAEFREIVTRREGAKFALASLERYAFYAKAAQCFAVVATAERRLYGNIILKKGVVRPG
ncbi:MAG: ribose ABC transporter [Pseudomonadota bacterium]|nr:ribose ABC transporter [Pseudomonadota bacterium]